MTTPRWVKYYLLMVAFIANPSAGQSQQPDDIATRARAVVNAFLAEAFEDVIPHFDGSLLSLLSGADLRAARQSLVAQMGAPSGTGSHTLEQVSGRQVIAIDVAFERGRLTARVTFNQLGKIIGLRFAPARTAAVRELGPSYADTTMFSEREVVIGSGKWGLPGTLSVPRVARRVPAVVLVHGSGPHDRDQTLGSRKPFRDIAWALASKGIAVLRYDKRTFVHADKLQTIAESVTVAEETIDDALFAIDLLTRTEGIDPEKVFLLGHSLGGMLAPRIGVRDCRIAGLIIMAGPARPLEDVILDQTVYLAQLDGNESESEGQQLRELREQVASVKRGDLSRLTPSTELPLGLPASYWLDLRGYDAATTAAQFGRPLLILHAGRDHQVTHLDLGIWRRQLRQSSRVQYSEYSSLGHLFMDSEGGVPGTETGYVSRAVVEDIARWVASNSEARLMEGTSSHRRRRCSGS